MKTLEELESEDDRINTVQIEHDNTIAELEKRVDSEGKLWREGIALVTDLCRRLDERCDALEPPGAVPVNEQPDQPEPRFKVGERVLWRGYKEKNGKLIIKIREKEGEYKYLRDSYWIPENELEPADPPDSCEARFSEKDRRIYYQDIVYHVCRCLDKIFPKGKRIVCGTVDSPTRYVQDAMDEVVRRLQPNYTGEGKK